MSLLNPFFGVMQGRLLPKYVGRYQAHPFGYWKDEFPVAKSLGLHAIEFILDFNDAALNPLMSVEGVDLIMDISLQTGVKVLSVCADYFMEAPLHHVDEQVRKKSSAVLETLLINGKNLGITDIVLPCVDQSSLTEETAKDRLVETLTPILDLAEKNNINISLETDLPPIPFAELLERFDSKKVTVNYDTGNSASLGYNPMEEFACYGQRISDIHIKDRVLGGGSVFLGTGNTNFSGFFKALSQIDFKGPFILQVYRDDEGIDVFKKQFSIFKELYTNTTKQI